MRGKHGGVYGRNRIRFRYHNYDNLYFIYQQRGRMNQIATIAGYVTAISAGVTLIIGIVYKIRCIIEAFRCLLRTNMLHTYYTNKETKSIRQYELQNFELNYKAYKALGGNSFIDDIRKTVITWEVLT